MTIPPKLLTYLSFLFLVIFLSSCNNDARNNSLLKKKSIRNDQQKLVATYDYDINFERLGIVDGLSQSSITCILQDNDGFMWFGTQNGLNKYDGYNYKSFKNEQTKNSISDNYITALSLDNNDSIIWVGTNEGNINKYNTRNNEWEHISIPKLRCPINAISIDNNDVWIGSSKGVVLYDKTTGLLKNPFIKQNDFNLNTNSIYKDIAQRIWVSTDSGLYRIDKSPYKYSLCTEKYNINFVIQNKFTSDLIAATSVGILSSDSIGDNWKSLGLPKCSDSLKEINVIIVDSDTSFWFGTSNDGLFHFNKNNNNIVHLKTSPLSKNTISNDQILFIYEDNSGCIWIGTHIGLNKYNKHKKRFINYNNSNAIWSFCIDRHDILLVGSEVYGLFKLGYNETNKKWDQLHKTVQFSSQSKYNTVFSICHDTLDQYLIGTSNGIYRYNSQTDEKYKLKILNGMIIRQIIKNDGVFIVATESGLFKVENEHLILNCPYEKQSEFNNDFVSSILIDNDENLWFSTLGNGLKKINSKSNDFETYDHNENDPLSITSNTVTTLFKDSYGNIWIGTDKGLNKYDLENNSFIRYSKQDGFLSDVIYSIIEDNDNKLWVSTLNGITRITKHDSIQNFSFRTFDVNDGLQSNEFNSNSVYKYKEKGELFFGGINGFNSFIPSQINNNNLTPEIKISDFYVLNEDGQISSSIYGTNDKKYIELQEPNNGFELFFTAIDFANPKRIEYKYRIIYDNDNMSWYETIIAPTINDTNWNNVKDGPNRIKFTYLKPGKYMILLMSTNSDGVWTGNEDAQELITVIIKPPFRKRWSFFFIVLAFSLSFLIITVLIFLIYRKMAKAIKDKDFAIKQKDNALEKERQAKNKLKEQNSLIRSLKTQAESANKAKTEFLSNYSHEIHKPLNPIVNYSRNLYNLLTVPEYKMLAKKIQINGQILSRVANTILNISNIENDVVELHENSVYVTEIIRSVIDVHSEEIKQKNLEIKFDPSNFNEILILDRGKIEQILLNVIGNSVKFTNKGSISIDIKYRIHKIKNSNNIVIITVSDTGIGISKPILEKIGQPFLKEQSNPKYEGVGIGLSYSMKLINRMGGKLSIRSEKGQFTKVRIGLMNVKVDYSKTNVTEEEYSRYEFEGCKILIIDDTEEDIKILKDALSEISTNFNIYETNHGNEGILLAKSILPDIIFLDMKMSPENGKVIARKLYSSKNLRNKVNNTRIFAYTASCTSGEVDYYKKNLDGYLTKPITPEAVIEILKKYVKYSLRPFNDLKSQNKTNYFENLIDGFDKEQITEISSEIDDLQNRFNEIIPLNNFNLFNDFAINTIKFSQKYSFIGLLNFGNRISDYSGNFDILGLQGHLKLLPEIIKKLKLEINDEKNN